MNNVLINLEEQNVDWMIRKHFNNRCIVSIDELLTLISNLDDDLEETKYDLQEQKEKYERKLQMYEDNYKPKSAGELYDVYDSDFH